MQQLRASLQKATAGYVTTVASKVAGDDRRHARLHVLGRRAAVDPGRDDPAAEQLRERHGRGATALHPDPHAALRQQ